ncbi:DUF222 domain-containing protein [Microbacterium sp. NPDC055910]|uniref:HNH endonuclease signature motif containing protein n=1 Tax=Microbacterium sp. NPDC055910 TaxID=3345659 RepID=UPI0035D7519F
MTSNPALTGRLVAAVARVAERVSTGAESASDGEVDVTPGVAALDDDALLAVLADVSEARNALDLVSASAAAEIARRSSRELGHAGLAQRKGHRNVTSLVQNITGQSRTDVGRTLKTGEDLLVTVADVTSDDEPRPDRPSAPSAPRWRMLLREALTGGKIGQAQFQAILIGIGEPPVERYPELDPEFLPEAWANAVELLLHEAATLPVEELRATARIARDRLDPVGVTLRFEERFAARSFRMWIDEQGRHHARIAFDDEAAAWVQSMLHAALRPRRGPRFVGSDAAERAKEATADERTNEQLQYDTVVAVLRSGANADPRQAFGDRQPGVRVVVEASAIESPSERGGMRVAGVGHVEHSGAALPGGVIEKLLCDAGAIAVTIDPFGRPLDVGREERLFTRKQRIAIAIRDGGCIWPGCTAPIDWSEFHHTDHWYEDHGRTDIDDGVPLCRNCHLRLHNQGWRIIRKRDQHTQLDTYWLQSPPDPVTGAIDEPIRLESRSPRRFQAA